MSFVHLLLNKSSETTNTAEYLAVTPDFSEGGAWEPVARVVIDKVSRDYEFIPINRWAKLDLVHPKLYGLSDIEREAAIGEGASCGAWTGRIHEWTMRLAGGKHFPETYPN